MAATEGPGQGLSIAALVINVVVLPGLGSVIGGRGSTGAGQLLLGLSAWSVLFFDAPWQVVLLASIGIMGTWVWALVTGIRIVQSAVPAVVEGPGVRAPDAP